jgi:microcystin-dependent protein
VVAEPFLSEIRLMSFVFPPKGWALCNGQLLPINQNQALFSLLGTTFGGDGRVNFALPDMRGRVPIHVGSSHVLGERGGELSHTLSVAELPAHRHAVKASTSSTNGSASPSGKVLGGANNAYSRTGTDTALHPGTVQSVGGNQAHLNTQPFLTISFCIALQGIFPSPT